MALAVPTSGPTGDAPWKEGKVPLGARKPFRTGDKCIYLQAGAVFVLRATFCGGQTVLEDVSVAQKGDQGRGMEGLGQDRQLQGLLLGEVCGEPARGCGAGSRAGEEAPGLRDPSPPPGHLSPALWTSNALRSLSLRNNRQASLVCPRLPSRPRGLLPVTPVPRRGCPVG